MKKYLPTRPSIKKNILLLGLVIGYYIIDSLSLFSFMGHSTYNLFIKPLYWGLVIFIVLRLPKLRQKSKLRLQDNINFWSILFATVYILVWFGAGIIDGYGKSPYDSSPFGLTINILNLSLVLIGNELIRNQVMNTHIKKENAALFMMIMISFFYAAVSFNINKYSGLIDFKKSVIFLAEFFLPCLSRNFMATYLTYIGGPLSSIIYLGIISIAEYVSPILPDLEWITSALVGIICPIFSLIAMQNIHNKLSKKTKRADQKEDPIGWLITCIFSIGLIWFVVGVFPVYPSVVATGSMEPLIKPGDVILVRKTDYKEVKEGEIIQFRRDDILISHRVVQITEDDEGINYRTKGDNNPSEDSRLVKPEEIKGKVVQIVPKIGWPTLLLKQRDSDLHDTDLIEEYK